MRFGVDLRQDLEALDRSVTPWVIAMMHCPWYNSNLAHQGERQTLTAMRAMEPLLYKHKTAVVIAGHVHGESSCPPQGSGSSIKGRAEADRAVSFGVAPRVI